MAPMIASPAIPNFDDNFRRLQMTQPQMNPTKKTPGPMMNRSDHGTFCLRVKMPGIITKNLRTVTNDSVPPPQSPKLNQEDFLPFCMCRTYRI